MTIFDIAGKILKPLLLPFALLYGLVVTIRNYFYDRNWFSSVRFDIPVIAVGNLSTGGTGKTPHIEYLIELLQYQYRIATLSRGYKRKTQGFKIAGPGSSALSIGDEPMQYFIKYPGITVTVGENRMLTIPELLTHRPYTEAVLLDDAFQHRSVQPGVNIMITDYHRPFYTDYMLPFGRLRERRSSYRRADIIIVSKCPDDLSEKQMEEIRYRIQPAMGQQIYFTRIQYGSTRDFYSGDPMVLAPGTPVVLVAGIADPGPLLAYLRHSFNDIHLLDYPDHHYFHGRDIEEIKEVCNQYRNAVLLTTEKDAVRLALFKDELRATGISVSVLPIRVSFIKDKNRFDQYILDHIERERMEQAVLPGD